MLVFFAGDNQIILDYLVFFVILLNLSILIKKNTSHLAVIAPYELVYSFKATLKNINFAVFQQYFLSLSTCNTWTYV